MSTVPAAAKKPADRQAKKNEAKPEKAKPVQVEWNGHTYDLDRSLGDDVELLEALEDDALIRALRIMLGAGWESYKENERNEEGRVLASGLEPFLTHCFEVLDSGESSASSTS